MTLLEIVQEFCRVRGLPVPTSAYGSSDAQISQIVGLLQDGGIELAKRGIWQELVNEATLTTLAAEDQGAISSIATNGFRYIMRDTIWDRSSYLPICGPMTGEEWQRNKAYNSTGPRHRFRIRINHLYISPAPAAGLTWAFEYMSKNWIETAASSGIYRDRFNNDNNIIVIPEDALRADLKWRWRKEKGLAYAEDFASFERLLADLLGTSGGAKQTLSIDGPPGNSHGIHIQPYSWNL